jgi:cobalt-zinc-cadmium efflux system membrane fusion protein
MQIWTLKNRKTLLIITVAVLGLFGARWIGTNSLMAQDGHEHTEKTSDHNDHADHDEDSGHEGHGEEAGEHANQNKHDERDEHEEHGEHKDVVMLSDADMKKFGIEVAIASAGKLPVDISLPGKVTVNEDRIAHVTPRVPGVVREVRKTLGDRVHGGEILAILDSPEMGEAQVAYLGAKAALDVAKANADLMASKLQVAQAQRDVARTQVEVIQTDYDLAVTRVATVETTVDVKRAVAKIAETDYQWGETVHDNTSELLKQLTKSTTIDEITDAFKGKPIGENRKHVLQTYAELNFADAAYEREKTLRQKGISSESDYLEAQKGYTIAKAAFEATTEELAFQNRLVLMEKKRAVDAAMRDIQEAEQSLRSAEGAVKSAASAVHVAESALQAAEMEIRAAEQNLKVARQTLEVARSKLWAAERKLHILGLGDDEITALNDISSDRQPDVTRSVMYAPFDGIIVEKHIVLGEALKDDSKAFVVADLSSVWVTISVYQKDLPVVRKGLPVVLSAGPGIPTAREKIAWVSPLLDEHTRTALGRVVLPNPDGHWRPGLFVTAEIAVNEINVSLLVPRTALQTVEDLLSIFVQTEEGFAPQPVTLGRTTETYAEVTKGLQSGQRYVTKGAFTLKAELGKGAFGDGHAH